MPTFRTLLEQTWYDLRYALRGLRRTPAFTATAVLTLGCGIGVTTAVFAVLNATVLRPLPYSYPEQLVELGHTVNSGTGDTSTFFGVTWPEIRFWRAETALFAGIEARDFTDPPALWREGGVDLQLGRFTAGLPSLLGVSPLLGRTFSVAESESKASVLLLSEALWIRGFARSPSALGSTVTLDKVPFTVIGVMPASFRYGPPGGGLMDVWSGLPEHAMPSKASSQFTMAVCRLQSGVSLTAANAAALGMRGRVLDAVGPLPPPFDVPWAPSLGTLDQWRMRMAREYTLSPLLTLLGTGGLVLIIACANVTNLLLARGMERRDELRLRSALGASRGRLGSLLLIEGLVITTLAGGLGLLISQVALYGATALMPAGMSRTLFEVGPPVIDWRVGSFVLATAALVACLASLWPALSNSRVRLVSSASGRVAGTSGRRRAGMALQSTQVALALLLAIGAGLLARSLHAATTTNIGFDLGGLNSLTAVLPNSRYATRASLELAAGTLTTAVERVQGVGDVAIGEAPTGISTSYYFEAEGRPAIRRLPVSVRRSVGRRYFATAGIRLVEGREFGPEDVFGAPPVVIVDEALAKRLSADSSAIGRRFRTGPRESFATVIGVVTDTMVPSFTSDGPQPGMYRPWSQQPATYVPILFRSDANASRVLNDVRTALWSVEPDAVIVNAGPVSAAFDRADTYQRPRFMAALVSLIAALALLTTAVGLYGLLSYSVGRRQREIGVRVALGSTIGQIRQLVVAEALQPVIVGIAIGWAAAWLLVHFVASFLYGVSPRDPLTFAVSGAVLLAAALLATIGPIRKATGVDPMRALRAE